MLLPSRRLFQPADSTDSDLPLIASLEVHTNPVQQQMMVDIMRETWGPHLVDPTGELGDSTPLPTLDSLRNKILIKVKYSPAKTKDPKTPKTDPPHTGTDIESSEGEAQVEAVKKGKIIPALGSLGIYTRSCHFKSFDQPEAKLPTHVFALSESKIIDMHEINPTALSDHNKVR